jgi:hypothetical protein
MSRRYHFLVDRVVHVPYTVEQDETGWWSAHASLPGGGANGEGQIAEEAVADLREALDGWFAEFGVPRQSPHHAPPGRQADHRSRPRGS